MCELIQPEDTANYADTSYWISLSLVNRGDNKEKEREEHNEMHTMRGKSSNLIVKKAMPYHANVITHLQINYNNSPCCCSSNDLPHSDSGHIKPG